MTNSAPDPLYTRAFGVACLLHLVGGMSLSFFILGSLYVRELGGTEAVIGLVLGIGTAASVAARPQVGFLLDRVGRRRMLLWGNALNALSYLPFLGVHAVGVPLVLWTIVHDVLWGLLFASYFTYAADLVPATRRAEGITVFGIFGMATNGLAPVLGEAIIARAGYDAFFVTAALFGAAAFVITAVAVEEPARGAATAGGSGGILHAMGEVVRTGDLGLVLAATGLLGAGINAAFVFVAPFTRHLGLEQAAPFFAASSGASILIRLLGRRVADQLGPHRVAIPAFALYAAGLSILCLMPGPGVLVAAGTACGIGHGSLFPVLGAVAVTRTPARLHGTGISMVTAVLDLGAVIGTPLCGLIAHGCGYPAMFMTMAGASLGGLLLMVADRRARR